MSVFSRFVSKASAAAIFVISVALLSLGAAQAQQKVSLPAFYGKWVGSAVSESEISVHFQLTVRDIGVEVNPLDGGAFELTWSTVQRQKGNPDAPTEVLKSTTLVFEPAPGRSDQWWAKDTGTLKDGQSVAWARLDKNALVVNSFAVNADGSSELQTYSRALTGLGMELKFTRVLDGELVRSAEGKLTKFSQ